jgi:hypothetical protein
MLLLLLLLLFIDEWCMAMKKKKRRTMMDPGLMRLPLLFYMSCVSSTAFALQNFAQESTHVRTAVTPKSKTRLDDHKVLRPFHHATTFTRRHRQHQQKEFCPRLHYVVAVVVSGKRIFLFCLSITHHTLHTQTRERFHYHHHHLRARRQKHDE